MHYYACPYCDPCLEARLDKVIAKDVSCKYDREDACEEKHKCKEVFRCKKCKNEFVPNKKFLKDQRKKIKDG